MKLKQDEIKEIEQDITNLKRDADNFSYNPPSPRLIRLTPSFCYKKIILLLIAKTNVGPKIEKDFTKLDQLHKKYENWRGKTITDDNEEEFTILVETFRPIFYSWFPFNR